MKDFLRELRYQWDRILWDSTARAGAFGFTAGALGGALLTGSPLPLLLAAVPPLWLVAAGALD